MIKSCSLSLAVVSLLLASSLSAQAWTQLSPATSPSSRNTHVICTDTARRVTVLFSGMTSTADTWEFDGKNWQLKKPTVSPPARANATMTYDRARKVCVLFGGRGSAGNLNDTWEWDGTNWKQIATKTSPSTRYGHAQCYDSIRKVTVMFSGIGGSPYHPDTWEYDGTDWKQVATTGPIGRIYSRMAFDLTRGKAVLFSGYAAGATPSVDVQDTWEWDGKTWTQQKLALQPLARWGHDMSYVIGRGIVMFGGAKQTAPNNGLKNDTWIYNGKGWAEVKPASPPTPRRLLAMAVHPTTIVQTLLFGGSAGGAETHSLSLGIFTAGTYSPYGTSCVGSNGSPTLGATGSDAPYINAKFTARLTNIPTGTAALLIFGASNTQWGAIKLPLDLSAIANKGCSLQTDLLFMPLMLTAGNTASLTLPLSNDPTLVGLTYYNQAFVLDPPRFTMSNGAAATIGRR